MANKFDPLLALKPGQISRTKQHIKEYAKSYCRDMIDVLYDIAQDNNNYARDRIQAAEAILNRSYGRPTDANNQSNDFGDVVDVQKLTTAQLQAMLVEFEGQSAVEVVPELPAPNEGISVMAALVESVDES